MTRLTLALLAAGGLLLPGAASAQDSCGERAEPAPGLLVSAEWLRRHREDSNLVVLHVERTRAPYDSAHVAGARFIAMGDFTTRNGELLTELPPDQQLDSLLESLGVPDRGRIVLYGETLPVARLFFTLDYLGLGSRLSVLNGGLPAWTEARGPISTDPTPPAVRSTLTLTPRPELLADLEWVKAHRTDPGVVLIDARNQAEFEGSKLEDGVARAGHIPGATNLDWTATIADGKFLDREALKQLMVSAGAVAGKQVVAYCRVGTRASVLYFVARLLGYSVRLYDGSMNEWAGRVELPIGKSAPH